MSDAFLTMDPREGFPARDSVTGRTTMHRTTVYALIKAGQFPKPVKLGRSSAWSEQEVDAWIEKQKAARNEEAA